MARAEAEHPLDQIDAVHEFGHTVLHLQSGVDLEEPCVATVVAIERVGVDDELDGAGRSVVDRLGEGPRVRRGADRVAVGDPGRRRLLDHLLVAALHGTVAFTEIDDGAGAVAGDLHLDVARPLDEPFGEHGGVTEVRGGESAHAVEGRLDLVGAVAAPQPDPAAARRRLEHQGEPDLLGGAACRLHVVEQPTAWHERDAGPSGEFTSDVLRTELPDLLGRGAEEDDPGRFAASRELGRLRQEAVARMDRVGTGIDRGLDDRLAAQIAVRRRRPAQGHGDRGHGDVQRATIGVGVDRDRLDAEPIERGDDAAGDLPTVGDEHALERT